MTLPEEVEAGDVEVPPGDGLFPAGRFGIVPGVMPGGALPGVTLPGRVSEIPGLAMRSRTGPEPMPGADETGAGKTVASFEPGCVPEVGGV